jgi:hypothetical protein
MFGVIPSSRESSRQASGSIYMHPRLAKTLSSEVRDMNLTLRLWDKGSRTQRKKILQDFLHSGQTIDQSNGNAASLLLSRVISWMKLTRTEGVALDLQLRFISMFVCSTTGSVRFLGELLDSNSNGLATIVDILTQDKGGANVREKDRQEALRLLFVIAQAGRVYKERVCMSDGISGIVDTMIDSESMETQDVGRSLLVELGTGNPRCISDVCGGLLCILTCRNPIAQCAAGQAVRQLVADIPAFQKFVQNTPSIGEYDPNSTFIMGFVKVALSMLQRANLQVQYEAIELVKLFCAHTSVQGIILAGIVMMLKRDSVPHDEGYAGSELETEGGSRLQKNAAVSVEGLQVTAKTGLPSLNKSRRWAESGETHDSDVESEQPMQSIEAESRKRRNSDRSGGNNRRSELFIKGADMAAPQVCASRVLFTLVARDAQNLIPRLIDLGILPALMRVIMDSYNREAQVSALQTLALICRLDETATGIVQQIWGSELSNDMVEVMGFQRGSSVQFSSKDPLVLGQRGLKLIVKLMQDPMVVSEIQDKLKMMTSSSSNDTGRHQAKYETTVESAPGASGENYNGLINAMKYSNSRDASPVPPSCFQNPNDLLKSSTGSDGLNKSGRGGKNIVPNPRLPPGGKPVIPPSVCTRSTDVKTPTDQISLSSDKFAVSTPAESILSTPRVPQTNSERAGRMERLERGWFPNEVNIPAHRLFNKDTNSPARSRQIQQFGKEKVTFVTSQDLLYTPFAHPSVKERESLAHTFTQRVSSNSDNATGTAANDTIEYLKHSQRKLANSGNLASMKIDGTMDMEKAHQHFKPYSETLSNPFPYFPNDQGKPTQPTSDIQDTVINHKSKGDLMVMKRRQREEKRREIMKAKAQRRKEYEDSMNEKMKQMKEDSSGFSNRAILQYMLCQSDGQVQRSVPKIAEE